MKKIIGLSLTLLIAFTFLTGCGCNNKENIINEEENNIKVNNNEDVIKDQALEVFTFTNTSLVYENSTSVLETLVTNTSDTTQYLIEFKIIVKDDTGKEIITLTGFIGDSIEAGESKLIRSSYGSDLTKAASIEYEIIR